MKYRSHNQEANLFSTIEHQQKIIRKNFGINKLNGLIDFETFRAELENILGYDKRQPNKGGRPPFDCVLMFKIILLQKFHGLSDQATQDQISDRLSFMQFLGLQMGDDIPDANTLWDFKETLGQQGAERLFRLFDQHLGDQGIIGREGTIVDASFVQAPIQRNSREQNTQIKEGKTPEEWNDQPNKLAQKDTEAKWTQKNNVNYYGYKNHIKIDAKTKLITACHTTSAEIHDSQILQTLVNSQDKAVLADSAYRSKEIETYLLQTCDCEDFILYKPQRNKPLTEEEIQLNRLRSRIRSRVEHIFARIQQYGSDTLRTIGKARAAFHITVTNLLYNLDRYTFLCRN